MAHDIALWSLRLIGAAIVVGTLWGIWRLNKWTAE